MIKFFRKIRQNILSENKFGKYLIYAIGEIILVVIGILIAVYINNSVQANKAELRELNLLNELKINLTTNVKNLDRDISTQIEGEKSINQLLDILSNKRPYNDSIPFYLTNGIFVPDVILTSSSFETLKSSGLEIIKSDMLRQQIINLFEVTYPYLMQETKRLEDQLWPAVVIPLMQKHCKNENKMWVPIDYSKLINDQEFYNMWSFRGNLRNSSTERKRNAKTKTLQVIELIENEIERRKK